MSKLNVRSDLWQRPKQKVNYNDACWFDDQVVGRDPLNELMKKLSIDAGLSKLYTNHSIRATTITKLDELGFEARHIQAVSGHKSENTIKCYSKKCPDAKKRAMSASLSGNIPPKIPKKESVTLSKPAKTNDNVDEDIWGNMDFLDFVPIENNAEDFDLGDIITAIDKDQQDNKQIVAGGNTNNSNNNPTLNPETIAQRNSYVQNVTNNQGIPFLPRNVFHNSNVTINYNFK